ncbi:hypothetical protein [Burkholderia cepacia]|uniref:hypothetical protein n=1 Tax=Burkholderia cepacia TaxID=292 RepID=UPI0012D97D0A|nr:hypothetical protein [Burkholderia cepacia]
MKTLGTPLDDAQHFRRQKDAQASFFIARLLRCELDPLPSPDSVPLPHPIDRPALLLHFRVSAADRSAGALLDRPGTPRER